MIRQDKPVRLSLTCGQEAILNVEFLVLSLKLII